MQTSKGAVIAADVVADATSVIESIASEAGLTAAEVRAAFSDADLRGVAARLASDWHAFEAGVGPMLSRRTVASLFGVSRQAVAKRDGRSLLALRGLAREVLYPAWQFDGARPVAGLDVVLDAAGSAGWSPEETAAWLRSGHEALAGRAPITALRDGDVAEVALLWTDGSVSEDEE